MSAIWSDLDIDDYAERRQENLAVWKNINGRQSGDSAKLAAALITVIDMPESRQRWVAGADAVEVVTAKADLLREQAHAFPELDLPEPRRVAGTRDAMKPAWRCRRRDRSARLQL